MLEAYQAFADFEIMAELVEEMTCFLAEKFCGGLQIEHMDENGEVLRTINLARPWKRANYHDLVKGVAGDDFFDITPEQRRAKCDELGVQLSDNMEDYEVIETLEHGIPPAGGIGIDRLIMMLTGAPTIRDLVLFPLIKKKD